MLEAIRTARSQMETAQRYKEKKQSFQTFIQETRKSIVELLSPVKQLEEREYGEYLVTMKGFSIPRIDAARDLNMPDAADYSMDVFIGRKKVGPVGSWVLNKFHKESRMVVDIAVNHTPSRKMVTNQVFFIDQEGITLWDRKNAEYPNDLPPELGQHTRFITDVLGYAAKLPTPLGSK